MVADYHTHTPLCKHAEGHPISYVQQAVELGLPEIGFSDHNPLPKAFDDWRMLWEEFPTYLEWIEEARSQFPTFPIRLGLEIDYFSDGEDWIRELSQAAPFDYLIGSVHYISPSWAVDDPQYISRFKDQEVSEIWKTYFDLYEKAIRSKLFDFVAHPDLPKKFGFRPEGNLVRYYTPIIQALSDTGVAFEINTAGLRKEVKEVYPAFDFLKLAREADIPLLINSDAHAPEEVGKDFSFAIDLAKKAGYDSVLRYIQREAIPHKF